MLKRTNRARIAAICVFGALLASGAVAGPPDLISYQGMATDAGGLPVADGPHTVDFIMYNVEFAGLGVWSELGVGVTTTNGLFSYELGTAFGFQPDLFNLNDQLWLEIIFDGETQSPRTRMTGAAYAQTSTDLYAINKWSPPNPSWRTDMGFNSFHTYGADGLEQIRLWGGSYGEVLLYDGTAGNEETVRLAANFSGGGMLHLRDGAGSNVIELNGNNTPGDDAVVLPQDAIEAVEMLNEPGFATEINTTDIEFTQGSSTMQDLVTITVSIPSAGYVMLYGTVSFYLTGTAGKNVGFIQIDETAGGGSNSTYYAWFGGPSMGSTSPTYANPTCTRSYFKGSAGNYTFRIEGGASTSNSAGATTGAFNSWISAQFFPTAYGPTNAIAESPDGFPDAVPVQVDVGVPGSGEKSTQTAYRVDLRQLELEATRARLAAEKAERQLAQAQQRAQAEELQRVDK